MRFDIRTVLSASSGRLLTKRLGPEDNGFGDYAKMLSHMVDHPMFEIMVPRIGPRCSSVLLKRFPELGLVDLASLDLALLEADTKDKADKAIQDWVSGEIDRVLLRCEYDIDPIDG